MQPKGLLPCLKDPAAFGLYSEPVASSPQLPTQFP
jgi:hypothetical protein